MFVKIDDYRINKDCIKSYIFYTNKFTRLFRKPIITYVIKTFDEKGFVLSRTEFKESEKELAFKTIQKLDNVFETREIN